MLSGSIVALVTPMDVTGSIDWEALAKLIEWHIEQKTDAIVITGTTGESPTLNIKEHIEVIAFTIKQVAGRIPVVAGTGSNSTAEAIELTQEAKNIKADACLIVTPYYNKPGQQGLYQHYVAIATSVDIPVVLYDVPGRTNIELEVDTIQKLSAVPNIIGIKDATGHLDKALSIKANCPDDFILLSGDDATFFEFILLAGGVGTISVTANIMPNAMHNICANLVTEDSELHKKAKELNSSLMPLHKALFTEANPIVVKYALQRLQKIQAGIRLPLTWASPENQRKADIALKSIGLI